MTDIDAEDALFIESVTSKADGWLEHYAAIITSKILRYQESVHQSSSLLEIGVYTGKYLTLLLRSAAPRSESTIGIDTFQYIPKDKVYEIIHGLMPELCDGLTLLNEPSTAFTADRLRQVTGGSPRFISIDGSHEYADVLHDLRICEAILSDTGVIAVDDFLNPLTIGVNRATNVFMQGTPNIVGFAYVTNKLFLARPHMAGHYREIVERYVSSDIVTTQGKTFKKNLESWRGLVEQSFFGYPLLLIPY